MTMTDERSSSSLNSRRVACALGLMGNASNKVLLKTGSGLRRPAPSAATISTLYQMRTDRGVLMNLRIFFNHVSPNMARSRACHSFSRATGCGVTTT